MRSVSRRTLALLALPFALNVASCLTRDSAGGSSRLRATTPVIADYGDDYKIYYHWGDGDFLDRLTNAHIPNHTFPGGEKDYGYYSDELYAELMQYSNKAKNVDGSGLYVAQDPLAEIFWGQGKNPKLIEVIIDSKIVQSGTLKSIGIIDGNESFVIKKNRGVYFREFSGTGLSAENLLQYREKLVERYHIDMNEPRQIYHNHAHYFIDRVDAILKNQKPEKVRLLPPPEWVYGNDYKVYYYWGDATLLDRLTSTHIPNHIYPGEEKTYGYYSDDLYAEIMQSANVPPNAAGPGLIISLNPITSINTVPDGKSPKLIEVIVDKRVVQAGTMKELGKDAQSELRLLKKNKGIYFREFSGAGFSGAQLLDVKEMLLLWNGFTPGALPVDRKSAPIRYFSDRVDAIVKNPPRGKVRMLPPREWACPQG